MHAVLASVKHFLRVFKHATMDTADYAMPTNDENFIRKTAGLYAKNRNMRRQSAAVHV
jgi:hypothetical protein